MGSDFNDDELVKLSSIVKDYNQTWVGEEIIRDIMCYKIQIDPLPEAPVVWERIISWITKDGYNLWKTVFYDELKFIISIVC